MVYHSSLNEKADVQQACGCSLLPIKTTTRGPAPLAAEGARRHRRIPPLLLARPPAPPSDARCRPRELHAASAGEDDIIDEVLFYFKANVLFKHFEVKGGADRTLIYLTLYTTQCLQKLEKSPSPTEGLKALTAMSHESFKIPGDVGFALGSFFPSPESAQEAELCRGYFKQVREELGRRLISRVYNADGVPSKFWTVFARKKFMNKAL
jgi:actin related protein 2/3 complex subunit 3